MTVTENQKKFMWLAHAKNQSFDDIAKILNVPRPQISKWEVELKPEWEKISAIKSIYVQKKIIRTIEEFFDWYLEKEKNKKCVYCNITEEQIADLFENNKLETKRSRGKKLELDRKQPNIPYDDFDNIVYACYWCNNAKTDTFTHEEFLEVGKVFEKIWSQRKAK
jgi:hypothetical protein